MPANKTDAFLRACLIAFGVLLVAVFGAVLQWCNRPAVAQPPDQLLQEIRNLAAAVGQCRTQISLPPPTMPRQIEWTDPTGASVRVVFDGKGHFTASFKSPTHPAAAPL